MKTHRSRVRRPPRIGVTLFAFLVALLVIQTAAAANMVQNPGFENDCMGIPCNWAAGFAGTIARDTSSAHSGSASIRVTPAAVGNGVGLAQQCVSPISPGSYSASIWYQAGPDPALNYLRMNIARYSGAGCSGSPLGPAGFVDGTTLDGQWNQASSTATVQAGTGSLQIELLVFCTNASCAGTSIGRFDDIVLDNGVTGVTGRSATATRAPRGVVVRWRTASEVGLLGFNVFREEGGLLRRVNCTLIRAHGGVAGQVYSFRDRRGGTRYRLQQILNDGRVVWLGLVRVR